MLPVSPHGQLLLCPQHACRPHKPPQPRHRLQQHSLASLQEQIRCSRAGSGTGQSRLRRRSRLSCSQILPRRCAALLRSHIHAQPLLGTMSHHVWHMHYVTPCVAHALCHTMCDTCTMSHHAAPDASASRNTQPPVAQSVAPATPAMPHVVLAVPIRSLFCASGANQVALRVVGYDGRRQVAAILPLLESLLHRNRTQTEKPRPPPISLSCRSNCAVICSRRAPRSWLAELL